MVDDSNPTSVALSKLLTVVENEEDSEASQSVESAELQAVAEAMAWDQPLSDTEEDY